MGGECHGARYITSFYCLAVEAGFYSDVVECLPLDPAAQVRFPPRACGIFLHPVTYNVLCVCCDINHNDFMLCFIVFWNSIPKVYESKKNGKDQESIQSSTTPDPGYQWESDNFTISVHNQKPRGQPFPSR